MKKIREFINNLSDNNRLRKYDLFIDLFAPTTDTKILDVGASEREYRSTANILEKKYPYPENVTVLGIDKYDKFCIRYPEVKVLNYEGDLFPFEDNTFDVCWCNAVVEHVGDWKKQELFFNEIVRVSKSAFITTPNKYFIYEPHTKMLLLHYLPKKLFDKILVFINKSWAKGDYMHLLGKSDIMKLLEKNNIEKYKILKNKILGFTFEFVIVLN